MKESKLIEMSNKIESLGRIVQHLLNENEQLKTIALGNLATMKKLDGYNEAIEALTKENEELIKEETNEKAE